MRYNRRTHSIANVYVLSVGIYTDIKRSFRIFIISSCVVLAVKYLFLCKQVCISMLFMHTHTHAHSVLQHYTCPIWLIKFTFEFHLLQGFVINHAKRIYGRVTHFHHFTAQQWHHQLIKCLRRCRTHNGFITAISIQGVGR